MTTINLQLKAKHFTGNYYTNCPIEQAAKDIFGKTKNISEYVRYLLVNGGTYTHNIYGSGTYDKDLIAALMSGNPETMIRTIKLTRVCLSTWQ